MLRNIIVSFVLIIFFSCHHYELKTTNTKVYNDSDNGPFAKDPIERRFTIPYPDNLQLDSNSLIFYRTSDFDTSLIIHFAKIGNSVKVICYETLPNYHRDINDFADKDSHLLFFEGYSFIIDTIQWSLIKSNAGKMLADSNSKFRNDGCADCGFGLIAHDYKIRRTNNRNRILYDNYDRWLKDSILKKFVNRRKPIMYKKETK